MKRRGLVVVALCFGLGVFLRGPAIAQASPQVGAQQSTGIEQVLDMHADVRVNKDGSVDITERIRYDFGPRSSHGIYRMIPVREELTDADLERLDFDGAEGASYERIYPLTDVKVSSPSGATPTNTEVTHEGSWDQIRIGDPDRTISGVHDYVIQYSLDGGLNAYDDHDELYLDIVGGQWEVPFAKASATITVPGEISRISCFQGQLGVTTKCASSGKAGDDSAKFTATNLSPGDAFTVVVAMPKGVVEPPKPIIDEKWSVARAFSLTPATGLGATGILGALLAGVGVLGFRVGRDKRYVGSATDQAFGNDSGESQPVPLFGKEPITVEFAPPDHVRPGLVGTLIDETANPLDVTATIIDLAVRGHLRIEEVPDTGLFSSTDYRLIRQPSDDPMENYESVLLNHIFESGDEVMLSALKQHFRAQLGEVQDLLYRQMVERGWYLRRPDRQRQRWAFIGVALLALSIGATVLLAMFTQLGLLGVALCIASLVLVVGSHVMPARTAKGTAMHRRILGFREMFLAGEGERQAWAEEQNIFSRYLPYAIVFGCADKWAATFAQLQAAGAVGHEDLTWWASPRPFDWIIFSHAIGSFSNSAAGQLAAAAPSSSSAGGGFSGFGGGGFSGGGFGGGGGGSW